MSWSETSFDWDAFGRDSSPTVTFWVVLRKNWHARIALRTQVKLKSWRRRGPWGGLYTKTYMEPMKDSRANDEHSCRPSSELWQSIAAPPPAVLNVLGLSGNDGPGHNIG